MATFTFILTTNGDFDVHRAGCRDIARVRKCGQHDVQGDTAAATVAAEVEDLNAEFGDAWTAGQFRVLPCAKEVR